MRTKTDAGQRSVVEAIERLRRLRASVRLTIAGCQVAAVGLGGLALVFAWDLVMEAGVVERAVLVLLVAAAVAAVVRRSLVPAILVHESPERLAMMIQRRQGLDTDLVAALQFADPGRAQFGSPHLRAAVVEHVEAAVAEMNLLEGFDWRPARPAMAVAAALLLGWLVVLVAAPGHVGAFAGRAVLAQRLYPTRTWVEAVVEPGVGLHAGAPLRFEVLLGGQRPESVVAELVRVSGSGQRTVPLRPVPDDPRRWVGGLPAVYESVRYRVRAGDGRTMWRVLQVAAEPTIELAVVVLPPGYAPIAPAGRFTDRTRIEAVEGSAIELALTTDRPLASVEVVAGDRRWPMTRLDPGRYRLAGVHPPLSPLAEDLALRIEARDAEGVALAEPPAVRLVVRPDRAPEAQVDAVTRLVLRGAAPTVAVLAEDDLGLKRVVLRQVVVPAVGENRVITTDLVLPAGGSRRFRQRVPVPLAALGLDPGDRVEVSVEAIDDRGELPGVSRRSAPWVFEVVDRQALLGGQMDADRALLEQLQRVIEAQRAAGGDAEGQG